MEEKNWFKMVPLLNSSNYLFEEITYNMHQFGIIIKFAFDRTHSVHLVTTKKKQK